MAQQPIATTNFVGEEDPQTTNYYGEECGCTTNYYGEEGGGTPIDPSISDSEPFGGF